MLLQPWMLCADWREDTRPFLLLDPHMWPADLPIDPLPPMPLIVQGPPDHPLARCADIVADPAIGLSHVIAGIERTPYAATALVDLLRAADGLDMQSALVMESLAYAALQAGEEHLRWRAHRPDEAVKAPGHVHLSREGDELQIVMDRPWAHNAIDWPMRDGLFDAFTLAAMDDNIRRLHFTGLGRCFSVGADLAEFGTTTSPARAHHIRMRTLPARALVARPDIMHAHVAGACVGAGLELAAFASHLTATPDAWFQLPEVAMGILPGAGGTVSVPRRIGRQRAALLMLSGRRISARTALRWGLVDALVDDAPRTQGQSDAIG